MGVDGRWAIAAAGRFGKLAKGKGKEILADKLERVPGPLCRLFR